MRSTPQSFKSAVRSTAEWAQLKAEQRTARLQRRTQSSSGAGSSVHRGMDLPTHGRGAGTDGIAQGGFTVQDPDGGDGEGSGDEYMEHALLDSPDDAASPGPPQGAAKSTLMQQFRRLSLHFQNENATAGSPAKSPFSRLHSFPHEKLHAGHASAPLCLTASVEEVRNMRALPRTAGDLSGSPRVLI
jgi:hypothetical protein